MLDDSRLTEAERLAETLHLPLLEGPQLQGFPFVLALTADRLELRAPGEKRQGPISSNLWDSDIRRRIQGGRRQPLARACGLHRDGPLRVLDATAGLGRDGMVLAGLGCEVTMLERSPAIAALLRDGLTRANNNPGCNGWLDARVTFLSQDAAVYMRHASRPSHDVVYLDPMYPQRSKRALAKKEMRVLRSVAGDDTDAGALLQVALGYAARRVVVKRPPWAEHLAEQAPDHQITGNLARYDVYLCASRRPKIISGVASATVPPTSKITG